MRAVDDPYQFDIEKYVATHHANDKGNISKVLKWLRRLLTIIARQEIKKCYFRSDPANYREVCWDLKERGGVGETVLHLCLLMATSIHADLGKRLLKFYPKLINDIYLSEEYYG